VEPIVERIVDLAFDEPLRTQSPPGRPRASAHRCRADLVGLIAFSQGAPVSDTISSFRTMSRSTSNSFVRSGSALINPYEAATDSTMVTRRSFIGKLRA